MLAMMLMFATTTPARSLSPHQQGLPMTALRCLLVSAVLLLTACAGGNPPLAVTHYLLPEDGRKAGAATAAPAPQVLVLRQLQLADYLDTGGLVLQLDDITLNAAVSQRWADPLGQQLQRGLRQRLQNRLPGTTLLDATAPTREGLQLRVEVNRFHGSHTGAAVAGGQWQLRDTGGVLLAQQSFDVALPLANDGYPALVRALGSAWDQVADEIAAGMPVPDGQ